VEKVGMVWVCEEMEVDEVKEGEEVKEKECSKRLRQEMGGFGEKNMGNGSIGLARR
jgi:hypothetical protein